jgi:SOS-response transcriptional repressor LexA
MDHQWDKPGKSRKTRPQQPPNQTSHPDLDETIEVWDFERAGVAQGDTAFNFTRRAIPEPGYRLIGAEVEEIAAHAASGGYHRPATLSRKASHEIVSRPNRYNSGVKMVAGDNGPDPWDWDKINYLKMPITGEVAAGRYDVTVAYHEPGSDVDADFVLINTGEVKVNQATTFALRVRGQSMIENEIDDGDVVIVQTQDWADDGDFVIACLADSSDSAGFVTLKRFYRHRQADRVVLQPANQSLNPIHILPHKGDATSEDLDAVKIQGRVTAIIKTNGLYQ